MAIGSSMSGNIKSGLISIVVRRNFEWDKGKKVRKPIIDYWGAHKKLESFRRESREKYNLLGILIMHL